MISRFFIYRPIFANVIAIVTILLGAVSASRLPVEQYPAITPPTVRVTTNYPGANADVVANTVAAPIETQVNGVEKMLYMSSTSSGDGGYTNTITFDIASGSCAGNGVCTITLGSDLPVITATNIIIDGYTQTAATRNTQDVGNNAAIKIAIDADGHNGIVSTGIGTQVTGLSIYDVGGAGGRGISVSAFTSSRSLASEIVPRARPRAIARQASAASWHVKALVEATPISGPASVGSTASDSRAMVEVRTLTMEAMRWPFSLQ